MTLEGLDHFTILTDDLDKTRRFYCALLGLREGPRPPFDFPGAWFYAGSHPVVHVVAGRPIPTYATGAVDHLAFRGSGDFGAMAERLAADGVEVARRMVPGAAVWQLFFLDPNGVRIELNYPPG